MFSAYAAAHPAVAMGSWKGGLGGYNKFFEASAAPSADFTGGTSADGTVHLVGFESSTRDGIPSVTWNRYFAGGLFGIRSATQSYTVTEIGGPFKAGAPVLEAVRAFAASPFAGEENVIYIGGFDANFHNSTNMAWIFKAGIRTILQGATPVKAAVTTATEGAVDFDADADTPLTGPHLTVRCGIPATDHRDLPATDFTSLVGARDALRRHRDKRELSSPGPQSIRPQHPRATVEVHGRCTGTLELTGHIDGNVAWIGAPNASHSGGLELPSEHFFPVKSPTVLRVLPPAARDHVLQLNLSAIGLNRTAIGELGRHYYPGGDAQINFFLFRSFGAAELYWNGGLPLHRARFPNVADDQLLIPQSSMVISAVRHGGTQQAKEPVVRTESVVEVNKVSSVETGRLKAWGTELANGRAIWAHGEWSGNGWSDTHKPVVAVDAMASTISTNYTVPGNVGGNEGASHKGGWFRVYNLLSELDAPGEYIIDVFDGDLLLLVYPPVSSEVPSRDSAQPPTLSMAEGPVLHIHDTSDVTFAGINIEFGRAWGAVFDRCDRCGLSDCVCRNFGINAVNVTGGKLSAELHTSSNELFPTKTIICFVTDRSAFRVLQEHRLRCKMSRLLALGRVG